MSKCPITPDELRDWICTRECAVDGANIIYELADWLQDLEQQQSPWVSVEDRLPEKEEIVLGWINGAFTKLRCDGKRWSYLGVRGNWIQTNGSPTHWLPIPMLPESEVE